MMKIFMFFIMLTGLVLSQNTIAFSQGYEISDADLPYIAMVRENGREMGRFAIVYNPDICKEIGDACYFFRRHEYAHGTLSHMILPPSYYPPSMVRRADCWAARNVDAYIVHAAYDLLTDPEKTKNLRLYGDLNKRAETIRDCAIEAGKWNGE